MTKEAIALIETFLDGSSTEEELRRIKDLKNEDSDFRQKLIESCKFNGIIQSASHEDTDCQKLIELVDLATGSTNSRAFEDRIINSLDTKVDIKGFTKIPTKRKTVRKRLNKGRQTQSKKRLRKNQQQNSKFILLSGIAAILAIISGLFIFLNNQNTAVIARIIEADGDAEIIRKGKSYRASNLKEIHIGDSFKGANFSKLTLRYKDGTKISLREGSHVDFEFSPNKGKQIKLRNGFLIADVAKQPTGKAFVILTPNAKATVVGTLFKIDSKLKATSMTVTEGLVNFTRISDRESVDVPANHRISTKDMMLQNLGDNPLKIARIEYLSLIYDNKGTVSDKYKTLNKDSLINIVDIPTGKYNFLIKLSSDDFDYMSITYNGTLTGHEDVNMIEVLAPYNVFSDNINKPNRGFNPKGIFSTQELKKGTLTVSITPYLDDIAGDTFKVTFRIVGP